jgi:hypothetical protein
MTRRFCSFQAICHGDAVLPPVACQAFPDIPKSRYDLDSMTDSRWKHDAAC